MQPPSDWMSERPIPYSELPLQAGSSPAITSEDRLSYARPSMHQWVTPSSSSPMVARFEAPVRQTDRQTESVYLTQITMCFKYNGNIRP